MNNDNVESIAEAFALLFQPYCEVILHDLQKDVVKKIFGSKTDRQIGEPSFLQDLGISSWEKAVHGPYRKITADGKAIKSISIIIRDDKAKPVNLLCINIDVTLFESARTILANLTSIPEEELDNPLANDWLERLHLYVANWTAKHGIQLKNIQPNMRKELVIKLYENDVFKEKNSVIAVAKALGVSRATIYQDLRSKDKYVN